jgi:hypothetical protein
MIYKIKEIMDKRFQGHQKRTEQLFGKKFSDLSRSPETLEFYKSHLEKTLHFPVLVNGSEDFSWEEFYVLGPGNKREYEILKKTQPSYTDVFKIIKISSHVDINYGLFAKLQRLSDGKRFELPLMDLRTIDLESEDYQVIEDYSIWFINYQ